EKNEWYYSGFIAMRRRVLIYSSIPLDSLQELLHEKVIHSLVAIATCGVGGDPYDLLLRIISS
ncbi:MAG: hypothetical protein KDE51_02045, partial [Anaerolineales bacterium]|nr:hypothetical protein [Anaerolineales bacterium]